MTARKRNAESFGKNVIVNCPFDEDYVPLLRPLLFAILRLGYSPRIATERSDSGENRIDKISELIGASRLGIHDISRLSAKAVGDFSRFNLPFELGLDRGARLFGATRLKSKRCLILESERYDYQRALSDLSGIDIKHHKNDPATVVRAVGDWFVETVGLEAVPSTTMIWYAFMDFASAFTMSERPRASPTTI